MLLLYKHIIKKRYRNKPKSNNKKRKDVKLNLQKKYDTAKNAPIGSIIECPSCGTKFEKKYYNSIFCKTKGSRICNDFYWNNVKENKRNRKHPKSYYKKYNTGFKSYRAYKTRRGYYFEDHEYSLIDDDLGWDAHKDSF